MTALQAEKPGYGGAEQKGHSSQNGGETKRSEAGSGEVEESRHGEGIVANAAMGEEIADVGDEGFVAGDPEAIDKSEDETTIYIKAVEGVYTEEINNIKETRE